MSTAKQPPSYLPLWKPSQSPSPAPPFSQHWRLILLLITAITLIATCLNVTLELIKPDVWISERITEVEHLDIPSSSLIPSTSPSLNYLVSETRGSEGDRMFSMVHPGYAQRLKNHEGKREAPKQVLVLTLVQNHESWGKARSFGEYLKMIEDGLAGAASKVSSSNNANGHHQQQQQYDLRREDLRDALEDRFDDNNNDEPLPPLYDISIALLVSDEEEYLRMRTTLLDLQTSSSSTTSSSPGSFIWSATLIHFPGFPNQFTVNRENRHGNEVQAERRRTIARLRNHLLYLALRPHSDSVVWIDADIVKIPDETLLERIILNEDKDIVTVRCERGDFFDYDQNSWVGPRAKPSPSQLESIKNGGLFKDFVPNRTPKTKFIS
ncbi:hypothetical protein HK102_006414, partial [Quaeritorhiza haematococci]